jgi:flavin reductase (DIM6/NTAB) family NADH-FMN oxidoreductase RutF
MAEAFERLVSLLDYPMFVVTTRVGDESAGCLVGFTSQVSIRPPRFMVGLSKRNHTYRVAEGAKHLAVHLVPRQHCELARLFGGETGDRTDKFARCAWHSGPNGIPILDDGDHVGFLLEPIAGNAPDKFDHLVTFSDVRDLDPGHKA